MLKAYRAGASSMLVQIIRELGIPDTIDNMVQWDPKQCKHSPGTHALAMMVNILMGRTALYRVEEFYDNLDVPFLFGMDAHASDFNDSVLGRTLDKIFEAGPKRVFSAAALRAAMREDVKVDVVHVDTTSWSLAGIYADSVAESEALHITYGFSKDRRPDLKQFNYGLVVSRDGIPLIGEAMDGNTSDKVWNRHIIEELVSKLASDLDSLVYVADSAAVTKDNLDLIAEKGIKFISRLPATFKQEGMVKDRAWADGSWQELGALTLNPKRDSAVYKCKDYIAEIDGRPYRLIVVHSSKLDKRKANKFERDLSKQKVELDEKIAELGALEFACEPDAQAALNRLRQECTGSFYSISGNVESEEVVLKRARRGRPRKGEEAPTKTVWRAKASVGPLNEEVYEHAKQKASCFVLITNIHDAGEYPADKVLLEYKEQSCVELSFKAIKEPEFVGAMYVKKPERLEALAYVVLLAALVRAVMQRRARRYAEATDEPLPIPGKRTSMRPTARMILDSFDTIIVIILPDGTRALADTRLFPDKMFNALGISPSVYVHCSSKNYDP